jgi:protein-tyrosine phosphatase
VKPEFSILFVCMGNICRSPTAHGVFRHRLNERQLDWRVRLDCAGTHDFHVGNPPDRRSLSAAVRRGIDFSDLRARRVEVADFDVFDLVLAMDRDNLAQLQSLRPATARAEVRLFLEFAPDQEIREVPDPYYGGNAGFEQVLDLVEQASEGLLEELARRFRTSARP